MDRGKNDLMVSIASGLLLLSLTTSFADDISHSSTSGEMWHQRAQQLRSSMLQHFRKQSLEQTNQRTASIATGGLADHTAHNTQQSRSAGVFPTYQVLDLGSLGGLETGASDINDLGEVTGSSELTPGGERHAFLYKNGLMTDLGTLDGGYGSSGAAINKAGQITGTANNGAYSRAFLYSNGEMKDLGSIDDRDSNGIAINTFGQVAGWSTFDGTSEYHAIRSLSHGVRNLGTLGDSYSIGYGINDAGDVAGVYQRDYETHAFIYSDGSMVDLVPGSTSYIDSLSNNPINSRGDVAGSYQASGILHAFLYHHGAAIDLGTLGGTFSNGEAINDASEVTGDAALSGGDAHAFVYSRHVMHDLGALDGGYSIGHAINNSGDVTGESLASNGHLHAFVYRDDEMIDLGLLLEKSLESFGVAINKYGQVVGSYEVLNDSDPDNPFYYRGFIATPISLLLTRLLNQVSDEDEPKALSTTMRVARRFFFAKNLHATCSAMEVFESQLNRERGLAKKSDKKKFTAEAKAIEEALGCDSASDE